MKSFSTKSSSFVVVACRAAAAALLRAVVGHRLRFHVAAVRQRHDDVLGRDEVFRREILRVS